MTSPTLQAVGDAVTYTVSVTGGTDFQYRWDFDDGAWPQTATVVQAVHLPLTAKRPTGSSNIVFEDRTGANDRVWKVNQDNDSVSVFDAVTDARPAEITVGNAP